MSKNQTHADSDWISNREHCVLILFLPSHCFPTFTSCDVSKFAIYSGNKKIKFEIFAGRILLYTSTGLARNQQRSLGAGAHYWPAD